MPNCFYSLRTDLKRLNVVMYARKSFPLPLKRAVDQVIQRLQSAGIIEKWISREWDWRLRYSYSKNLRGTTTHTHGNNSFIWAAFQLLIFGLLVSVVLCAVELASNQFLSCTHFPSHHLTSEMLSERREKTFATAALARNVFLKNGW